MSVRKKGRQYPELPFGGDYFPKPLPWAAATRIYFPDDVDNFCITAYSLDAKQVKLLLDDGESALKNYIAHAKSMMTRKGLHIPPKDNDGVNYRANPKEIYEYCLQEKFVELVTLVELGVLLDEAPGETEVERWGRQRLVQDAFRNALLRAWDTRCPLTGIDHPDLLRASHIKPWSMCTDGRERIDLENGILLAAHVDAAFDKGLLSFDDLGRVIYSPRLDPGNLRRLGIAAGVKIEMSAKRKVYMTFHRQRHGFYDNEIHCLFDTKNRRDLFSP